MILYITIEDIDFCSSEKKRIDEQIKKGKSKKIHVAKMSMNSQLVCSRDNLSFPNRSKLAR